MKALHITSHKGTIKNIENVFHCLHMRENLTTEPSIYPYYYMDEEKANEIWNCYEYDDKLASYSHIIFTDTSMVARPFLQNIGKHNLVLIIYITNRFDWGMWASPYNDSAYYNLFKEASKNERVIFCSDNKYDQYYASLYNIRFFYEEPIYLNPFLKKDFILYSIPKFFIYNRGSKIEYYKEILYSIGFDYELFGEGFIPYENTESICKYKAFFHLPYQTNIQSLWENLGYSIVYFIPSKEFILELIETTQWYYWEEKTKDPEILRKSIELSVWYQHPELFVYFSSWENLQEKVKNLTDEYLIEKKIKIRSFMENNNEKNIEKWGKILKCFS